MPKSYNEYAKKEEREYWLKGNDRGSTESNFSNNVSNSNK